MSRKGIMVESAKTEVIRSSDRPMSIAEFRSFIGLARYYRWFV